MFNYRLKIFPIIVACMVMASTSNVMATSLKTDLTNYKAQVTDMENQANSQAEKQTGAIQKAQAMQSSADLLAETIKSDEILIATHQKTIEGLRAKEIILRDKRDKTIASLGGYIRSEYEKSSTPELDTISFIVGSQSIGELIARVSYVENILNSYSALSESIRKDTKDIEDNRKKEQAVTDKLTEALKSRQTMQDGLKEALKIQQEIIDTLSMESRAIIAAKTSAQNNIDNIQSLIAAERMRAIYDQQSGRQGFAGLSRSNRYTKTNTNGIKYDGNAYNVISQAEAFLGTPYVWGGTDPNVGFDCSSLVQYAYRQCGIELPRVTWDQFNEGSAVEKNDLRAGDLVFFTTYAEGPSHVGIYIGDGIMIDDENSGVMYSSIYNNYYANRFCGARRILND